MKSIPVLVTGVGGGGIGEQIVKCLRMSSLIYDIVGGDMNRNSKGLAMVDHPYLFPAARDEAYIDTLLRTCKKHGVKALFTGSEPELKMVSRHREAFADAGVLLTLNPQRVLDICMDKNATMRWFEENGVNAPRSARITTMAEAEAFPCIPAVLKPSIGGSGSTNAFIARNEGEKEMFSRYLLTIYGEFIIQEYVGTCESEYTVGVLFDMEGNYLNTIAVKKNILSGLSNRMRIENTSGKPQYGKYLAISSGVSQGEIGRFPAITGPCVEIAKKLGCTGPANLQCREQDGKVYVFEINPRISGTSPLRAMVGYNEPDIMVRKYILGEDVPVDFAYGSGVITRGLDEFFIDTEKFARIEMA